MRIFTLALGILSACPAFAERQRLTPQDFEARVAGRAMQIFNKNGDLFGVDYFLPKQRVIRQNTRDGRCYQGVWSAQEDRVCFRYEPSLGNCFRYYLDGDQMVSVDFVAGIQTTTSHDVVVVNLPLPNCAAN